MVIIKILKSLFIIEIKYTSENDTNLNPHNYDNLEYKEAQIAKYW